MAYGTIDEKYAAAQNLYEAAFASRLQQHGIVPQDEEDAAMLNQLRPQIIEKMAEEYRQAQIQESPIKRVFAFATKKQASQQPPAVRPSFGADDSVCQKFAAELLARDPNLADAVVAVGRAQSGA